MTLQNGLHSYFRTWFAKHHIYLIHVDVHTNNYPVMCVFTNIHKMLPTNTRQYNRIKPTTEHGLQERYIQLYLWKMDGPFSISPGPLSRLWKIISCQLLAFITRTFFPSITRWPLTRLLGLSKHQKGVCVWMIYTYFDFNMICCQESSKHWIKLV